MRKPPIAETFDAKVFLAKPGTGKANLHFHAGAEIYAQGDVADAIYFLQKGKIKITVWPAESGKEAVLSIVDAGDFFGEGCLNGQPLRMATVSAMTDCAVMRIDKATMLAELHDQPKFAEMFIAHLVHRNSRIEEDLVDQLFNSSEKRLARTLLLANFGKEGRPEPVLAKISQETLAEMIGTTRSRVSFFMNKFRRLGLVEYNGRIKVNSALLSVVLNDGVNSDRKSLSGGR